MIRKLHQDIYISGALFALVAGVFALSLRFNGDAAVFPYMLAGGMLLLNLFILAGGIRKTLGMNTKASESSRNISFAEVKMPLVVFGFIVLYAVLFKYLGYFIATPLFILGLMRFYNVKNYKNILLIIVCFHLFIYLLFVVQLQVQLLHW